MSDAVQDKIKSIEKRIEIQRQEGKKLPDIKAPEANPAKLAARIRDLEIRVTKLETDLANRGEKEDGTNVTSTKRAEKA